MNQVFVFDLDGVIRHWDPDIVANAERSHGLPSGALFATSFEPDLLLSAVTGVITDEVWRSEVTRLLLREYPAADGAGAVAEWSLPIGEIVEGSVDVLRRARERGTVCLLSNATSRLRSDLAALGITDEFDHIFNSSEIGYAKPDERVFEHVERRFGVSADRIIYIDDGAGNIDAAAKRGWISLLATPETQLANLLEPYL